MKNVLIILGAAVAVGCFVFGNYHERRLLRQQAITNRLLGGALLFGGFLVLINAVVTYGLRGLLSIDAIMSLCVGWGFLAIANLFDHMRERDGKPIE